ncbi:MAG: phage tail protein, partial [Bryobacteraceae bacterium]
MPQYLSPGVYVEETSFRTATIEGVSTSTAAFVGPTRFGPITGTPSILTCLADFEGTYGSIDMLEFDDKWGEMINYVGQAVRSFFDNGGSLLYVSRTFRPAADLDGYARASLTAFSPAKTLSWQARYPGSEGNVTLTITLSIGPNVLSASTTGPTLRGVNGYDIVWISGLSSPPSPPTGGGAFYCAEPYLKKATGQQSWT